MIYNIEIKEWVRNKINNLSDYIYRFSFSKESAKKIYDEIFKDIISLKIFPKRYPKFNEKYRVLTIDKKYRIFFIVDDNKKSVIISRFFSSYQNYMTKF